MLIKQWLLSAHADHEDDDTTEGVDDLASQLEELCSHYAAEYGLRIYYEDLGETPTTTAGWSPRPVKAYHLSGRCYEDHRAAEKARRETLLAA